MAIRDTAVDLAEGMSSKKKHDPAWKGEKDPKTGYTVDLPVRKVGPSSTQIYMVRTMLESLLQVQAKGKSLHGLVSNIPTLDEFHRESFFYPQLLNFPIIIREASDLSQLWYREFFLELTMGKNIQFPIDQSLPWILTSTILESKERSMFEYLLYPLDLYSDAAYYSLYMFKKQYLFDEIEAEVNLIFDQLIFKVAQMVLLHFKQRAASILLENNFRANLLPGIYIPYPKANCYDTILKQRHVQLLGRSIDLHSLLAERIRVEMLKAVDLAIAKFESSDLHGLIELDILLSINRMAVNLLSEHIELDPFSMIFEEANESLRGIGKIESHILLELVQDFLPNYCYNSQNERFVKTNYSVSDVMIERENPPRGPPFYFYGKKEYKDAFTTIIKLYEGFIGQQHFAVIARLLSYESIFSIVTKLVTLVKGQAQENDGIIAYVNAIGNGMPPKCKLPSFQYGSVGVIEFYYAQLEPIVNYDDLKTHVFQTFREFGNTIIFFLMLEKAMGEEEMFDLHQGAPLTGKLPKPFVKNDQTPESATREMEQQYAGMNIHKVAESYGTLIQAQNAKEAELLTKERLCRGLTMFEKLMVQMKQNVLSDKCFVGELPVNGVMSIEECSEFHRLWSAIQFILCVPRHTGPLPEDVFGEGLIWGGLTIIYLLGQQRRFEALDFCNHILSVAHINPPMPPKDIRERIMVQNVEFSHIIKRIKVHALINRQIFTILDKYLAHSTDLHNPAREFTPPIYQNPLTAV